MKIKKLLFFWVVFSFGWSVCEGQSWVWVEQGRCLTRGYADVYSIATDNVGNIFEAGLGQGPIVFGSDSMIPVNTFYFAFLIKYDSNGNVLWTKNSFDKYTSFANYVATDESGNSYITGDFQDTIIFDTIQINRNGLYSFLTCYSSNGNVKWVAIDSNNSSNSYAVSNSVCTDKNKNIYITGYYMDTVFFGSYRLTGEQIQNFFIVKFDSLGNVLWVKNASYASNNYSNGVALTSDDSGNVYLIGRFEDTITLGSYLLSNTGTNINTFIVKYDPSGSVQWVQSPQITDTSSCYSTAIAADVSQNLYIAGYFNGTLICGIDTLIGVSTSAVIFKLSPGGQFVWSKGSIEPSSSSYAYPYSITIDKNKNVFTCGTFQDSLNFFNISLTSSDIQPSFLVKIDSMGNGTCGALINNGNDDQNVVTIDPLSNDIYFGGDYEYSECIFGQDTLLNIPLLGENSFLAKWQPCDSNIETPTIPISNNYSSSLFPNPNNGIFTIQLVGTQNFVSPTIEVYNVLGEKVLTETLRTAQGDNLINLTEEPSGIYFYRVLNENGNLLGSGKVVINK